MCLYVNVQPLTNTNESLGASKKNIIRRLPLMGLWVIFTFFFVLFSNFYNDYVFLLWIEGNYMYIFIFSCCVTSTAIYNTHSLIHSSVFRKSWQAQLRSLLRALQGWSHMLATLCSSLEAPGKDVLTNPTCGRNTVPCGCRTEVPIPLPPIR